KSATRTVLRIRWVFFAVSRGGSIIREGGEFLLLHSNFYVTGQHRSSPPNWMRARQRERYRKRRTMSANDKNLEIKIQSTRGTKEFSVPKETKIAEVTAKAITAFGFAPGDRFELVLATKPGEP